MSGGTDSETGSGTPCHRRSANDTSIPPQTRAARDWTFDSRVDFLLCRILLGSVLGLCWACLMEVVVDGRSLAGGRHVISTGRRRGCPPNISARRHCWFNWDQRTCIRDNRALLVLTNKGESDAMRWQKWERMKLTAILGICPMNSDRMGSWE